MIQRIQSVFLLLAAASAFCLLAFPFASTSEVVANSANFSDGLFNLQDNIGMMVLFIAAGALALISIFLYSNRKRQLLIGRFAIIANVIGLILAFAIYYNDSDSIAETVAINDEAGLYMPIVFLVFALLAQRFINKDEKLVKSMDRLR
ncbi:MAG: DUF4293 domain-containing protein [Bacteroidota bacterium]